MNEKQLFTSLVAFILTSLAKGTKTDPLMSALGGIPAGHLYAGCMENVPLDFFMSILASMQRTGYVTVRNHVVRLTEKGDEAAKAALVILEKVRQMEEAKKKN